MSPQLAQLPFLHVVSPHGRKGSQRGRTGKIVLPHSIVGIFFQFFFSPGHWRSFQFLVSAGVSVLFLYDVCLIAWAKEDFHTSISVLTLNLLVENPKDKPKMEKRSNKKRKKRAKKGTNHNLQPTYPLTYVCDPSINIWHHACQRTYACQKCRGKNF